VSCKLACDVAGTITTRSGALPVVEAVLGGPSVWQAPTAERGTAPRGGRAGLSGSERRLQGMPCLGAPARGVDVRVVGVNPEVIGVTPAIKVELGRKGRWRSGVPRGTQLSQEVLQAPGGSPCPWGLSEATSWMEEPRGQPHNNLPPPPHFPRASLIKLLASSINPGTGQGSSGPLDRLREGR